MTVYFQPNSLLEHYWKLSQHRGWPSQSSWTTPGSMWVLISQQIACSFYLAFLLICCERVIIAINGSSSDPLTHQPCSERRERCLGRRQGENFMPHHTQIHKDGWRISSSLPIHISFPVFKSNQKYATIFVKKKQRKPLESQTARLTCNFLRGTQFPVRGSLYNVSKVICEVLLQ